VARDASILRRPLPLIAVAAVVVLAASAAIGWRLAQLRPAWWPPSPDTEAANRVGQHLENTVSATLTQNRPADDAWTLVITQDHANAWLAGRMPKWLANRSVRMPDRYRGAAVSFEGGAMQLTVELQRDAGATSPARWLGIVVEPLIDAEANEIRLQPVAARIGRLRVPFGVLAGRDLARRIGLRDEPQRSIQSAAYHTVVTGEPMRIPSLFKLDDGRRVRVMDVVIDGGMLKLTCRTER